MALGYDAIQLSARWLCWLCCRREVYRTRPTLASRCAVCYWLDKPQAVRIQRAV